MAVEPGPQFYHGTHLDLNPGDLVQPRDVTGANPNFDPEVGDLKPDFNPGGKAYAITHPGGALFYGINSAERNNKNGAYDAKVYEVEPVDPEDLKYDKEGSYPMGSAYSSSSGFRVVKRHGK
jgi:hypothetical protein